MKNKKYVDELIVDLVVRCDYDEMTETYFSDGFFVLEIAFLYLIERGLAVGNSRNIKLKL